jgi:hypothetical protein
MAISDIAPTANNSLRSDVQQLSQQQRRAAATANKNSAPTSNSSSTSTDAAAPGHSGKPGQNLDIIV